MSVSLASFVLSVTSVFAQPYSAGLDDNDNAFDAPIPGFTGPGGEGKVDLPGYENPAGETSVNPIFLAWADTVADYSPALGTHGDGTTVVDPFWQFSGETLGPVTGDNFAIASLGDLDQGALDAGNAPGALTVSFAEPIRDFSGADFAVFENGFVTLFDTGGSGIGGVWAELAYVEVSSNGTDFARFPSVSLTPERVGAYGSVDPRNIYNLAGKHVNAYGDSWGTPFDLSELADDELVTQGLLDLDAITHIRLVDIPGSGDFLDSLGNPIYDGWVTWGSGGADVEAFGAVGQALTYDEWDAGRGLLKSDDLDQDGWSNLAEYAFRLNPEKADGFSITRLERGESGKLFLVFPRDERNASVAYIIETQTGSLEIENWTEAARFGPLKTAQLDEAVFASFHTVGQSRQASLGVLQEVFVELADGLPAGASHFFRVRVEEAL